MLFLPSLILAVKITVGAIAGLILVGLGFLAYRKLSGSPDTEVFDPAKAQEQIRHESRAHRWLVAFDIFCNVTFFNGQQDETISAHAWRAAQQGKLWGKLMTKWLGWFQLNHGAKAAAGDLERAQEREAVEKKALGL